MAIRVGIYGYDESGKIVISVFGGSGVGKSEIASLLAWYLNCAGIGSYVMSGDNYPRRIPMYNDAERLSTFRASGLKGLLEAGAYNEEVREKLMREYNHLQQVQFGSPENALLRNYLETCLALPWEERTNDRVDIDAAKKILDDDHDGLQKIKDRIIEYLAVKQLSPELRHQII